MEAIWEAESGAVSRLQEIGGWSAPPFSALFANGFDLLYLVAVPLLLWCVSTGWGTRLSLLLTGGHWSTAC